MKVKVKVPMKITSKQKDLINQIVQDELGDAESKDSSASNSSNPNSSFTINQAWKRLKEFLNHSDTAKESTTNDSKKSEKSSTEAKV